MFDNIGDKLMGIATVTTILGIIGGVIGGIVIIAQEQFLLGVLTIVGVSVLSWIGGCLFYGVGQICNDTKRTLIVQESASKSTKKTEEKPFKPYKITDKPAKPTINLEQLRYRNCPACMKKVKNDVTECPDCGQKLG